MIHIRRRYASMVVEIALRGVPSVPTERFFIPMELISEDEQLNYAYQAFRRRCTPGFCGDDIQMPLTDENHHAFADLMTTMLSARRHSTNRFEHTQNQTQRIARTSVLA